jgi:hypothetical protein
MSWLITPQLKTLEGVISNTVAWWDASDASSFTYSSGTVVQDWRSRVGNYTLTQATSANRPSRSGTVNGLSTVVFDGTNDNLSVANFDITPGGQKFSIWSVFSATSGGNQVIAEHSANYNDNAGAFLLFRTTSNLASIGKRGTTGAGTESNYAIFETSGTIATTPKAIIATHDGTLATDESSGRLNSSSSGARSINGNTSNSNINSTLFVGARNNTNLFLNGQICELGITTSVLSANEISLLESYLSSKWGLGF